MGVCLRTFLLDENGLPASIYAGHAARWSNVGFLLSSERQRLLADLLLSLAHAAGETLDRPGLFFRVDVYVDPSLEVLWVLEVNACFVDGWGTALALSRAAGHPVRLDAYVRERFPSRWTLYDERYRAEFDLALQEMRLLGIDAYEVAWQDVLADDASSGEPVYWYGRFRSRETSSVIWPYKGNELDNKRWLMDVAHTPMFSQAHLPIRIPALYRVEECPWESLPQDVVFKPVDKVRDTDLVRFRDQIGRGKGMRRAYNAGRYIAQERVKTMCVDDRPVQLVLLCAGCTPVTGYTLLADPGTRMINDSAEHGPLVLTSLG